MNLGGMLTNPRGGSALLTMLLQSCYQLMQQEVGPQMSPIHRHSVMCYWTQYTDINPNVITYIVDMVSRQVHQQEKEVEITPILTTL